MISNNRQQEEVHLLRTTQLSLARGLHKASLDASGGASSNARGVVVSHK